MRRRVALVLAARALASLLASGTALAVNKVGTNGADTLTGTNHADNLVGRGGNDVIDVINRPAAKDVVVCGDGFDRVLADSKDVVAPDCERVFVGLDSVEEFEESIPQSFWEGLAPFPEG